MAGAAAERFSNVTPVLHTPLVVVSEVCQSLQGGQANDRLLTIRHLAGRWYIYPSHALYNKKGVEHASMCTTALSWWGPLAGVLLCASAHSQIVIHQAKPWLWQSMRFEGGRDLRWQANMHLRHNKRWVMFVWPRTFKQATSLSFIAHTHIFLHLYLPQIYF